MLILMINYFDMQTLLPIVKWSGSKRSQAKEIVSYFPSNIENYFEPFLGGGSILASLSPKKAICGDICSPLIDLWRLIQVKPQIIIGEYKNRWQQLQEKKHHYYYEVRNNFNHKKSAHDLLFLSRTCVNGLIRFNKSGEFNNSFHHSRKGIDPSRFEKIVLSWSSKIQDYEFYDKDYSELTQGVQENDFVYLDPPYFNTKGRYFGTIDYERFIKYLENLNKKNVRFALSFDGKRGDNSFVVEIPKKLYKRHLLLHSGNSTFNKVLNNKVEAVYESLYLNY